MPALSREEKAEKVRAALAVKAERKAAAGLSRTIKLRLYPSREQAEQINRTIGAIRFIWNTIWLPLLKEAQRKRGDSAQESGGTPEAWKQAWREHPDPTQTHYTKACEQAASDGSGREWLSQVIKTPIHRAARNFTAAVQASRGRTEAGAARKVKAGRVQPRSRREDPWTGLEWQIQGKGPLGGEVLTRFIDNEKRTIKVPSLGVMRYRDKATLLKRYVAANVEACEMTVKREGKDYFVCIAVRGLRPSSVHANEGASVGIDMGVANPLSLSDGRHIIAHQGHEIRAHLERLERKKLRAKRQLARKTRAAARKAGALTATGSFKKGVRVETSNRARRLIHRINKIDRHIVGFRADWQRNKALEIVKASELVVVEALTIRNMTKSAAGTADKPGRNVRSKSGLNRAILARGWGSMRSRLKSKAEELAGRVIEVDPQYTSQTCPSCGHIEKANRLTQAHFACVSCGFKDHADTVGAMNIRQRGMTAGASPVAGRGGHATGPAPSGADAERAVEPSNKSKREPKASRKGVAGSRSAKPHSASNELGDHRDPGGSIDGGSRGTANGGSRNGDG